MISVTSLVPRPLPDLISQLWRKIWVWPENEAKVSTAQETFAVIRQTSPQNSGGRNSVVGVLAAQTRGPGPILRD